MSTRTKCAVDEALAACKATRPADEAAWLADLESDDDNARFRPALSRLHRAVERWLEIPAGRRPALFDLPCVPVERKTRLAIAVLCQLLRHYQATVERLTDELSAARAETRHASEGQVPR